MKAVIFLANLLHKFEEFIVFPFSFVGLFYYTIVQKLVFVKFTWKVDKYFRNQLLLLCEWVNFHMFILIFYLRSGAIFITEFFQNFVITFLNFLNWVLFVQAKAAPPKVVSEERKWVAVLLANLYHNSS